MDVFSLEEDDGDDRFLTQTTRNLVQIVPNFKHQVIMLEFKEV